MMLIQQRNINPGFLLKASISYLCCGFKNGTAWYIHGHRLIFSFFKRTKEYSYE